MNPVARFKRLVPLLLLLAACRATHPPGEARADDPERVAVEAVLDDFHRAASEADGERYFALMSPDCVFLGTDATERWSKEEFRVYAQARFDTGTGWTYAMLERNVTIGPRAATAWFDERLVNEKYGECRGTGALRKAGGEWKIAQYNLTFPVPNEIAAEVVERIRVHLESAGG